MDELLCRDFPPRWWIFLNQGELSIVKLSKSPDEIASITVKVWVLVSWLSNEKFSITTQTESTFHVGIGLSLELMDMTIARVHYHLKQMTDHQVSHEMGRPLNMRWRNMKSTILGQHQTKKVIANCMFLQVLRPTYNGPLYHSSSSSDFLSAQAHLRTKDRLWQMEFNRQIKWKEQISILNVLTSL